MTRVLVADDDEDVRQLLTMKLGRVGYEVVEASDGIEALAAARSAGVDLAVIDVSMPGYSGIEVCRLLRAEPATATLPIILLTAKAQEGDEEAGFVAGADDYVVKPFSPKEFVTRIEQMLVTRRR